MVPIAPTKLATASPSGMVTVPAANYSFVVKGIEIEGDDGHGVDVQFPWETKPGREHSKTLVVGPLYMDKFPVTNDDYAQFVRETVRPLDHR